MRVNPISFNYFNIPKSFSNKSFIKTDLPCDTVSFGKRTKKPVWKPEKDLEKCTKELKYEVQFNRYGNILRYFGIGFQKDEHGNLTISHYSQPSNDLTFKDFGVNEEKLIERVRTIEGDGDFKRTSLDSTKNVKHILGNCDVSRSRIKRFSRLTDIEGNLEAQNSLLKDFGNLEKIGGSANCAFSPLNNMNALKYVGGDLDLTGCYNLKSLGNLQHVGGDLYISDTEVTKAKNLKHVGGKIYLTKWQLNIFKNTMPSELLKKTVLVSSKYED